MQQLERSINSAQSLFLSIREHGNNKHLSTPKEIASHNRNIVPQKRFFSTKEKSKEDQREVGKARDHWELERGQPDQRKTEEQISSDNVNKEGEHVKAIELGVFMSAMQATSYRNITCIWNF